MLSGGVGSSKNRGSHSAMRWPTSMAVGRSSRPWPSIRSSTSSPTVRRALAIWSKAARRSARLIRNQALPNGSHLTAPKPISAGRATAFSKLTASGMPGDGDQLLA